MLHLELKNMLLLRQIYLNILTAVLHRFDFTTAHIHKKLKISYFISFHFIYLNQTRGR